MKKLLAMFGTIGLIATPMASLAASCSELKTPVFDETGDMTQFSDNWDFTALKTASLYVSDTSSDLQTIIDTQVEKLLAGRFQSTGKEWNPYFSGKTITYYESNSNDGKGEITNFTKIKESLDKDFDYFKTIYFRISNGDDKSDLMDLTLSGRPTVLDMFSFFPQADTSNEVTDDGDDTDPVKPSYTIDTDNTFLAWNQQYYQDGLDTEEVPANYIASDFAQYSKIMVNDESYIMSDFFLDAYQNSILTGKFESAADFETVMQNNIDPTLLSQLNNHVDQIPDFTISGAKILVKNYVEKS